jgi:hypothetical protein
VRGILILPGLILVLLVARAADLGAQGGGPAPAGEKAGDAAKSRQRLEEFIQRAPGTRPEGPEVLVPPPEGLEKLDEPTRERYAAALREYYNYRLVGYRHRQRVFEWQLFSSKVIFGTVLGLVAAGIYFAWVQFHAGLARQATTDAPPASEVTEIEASPKGIKVSSPVLGVIILLISLAFFYLYLVFVYPIQEIF